jgi:hypothetical protein
MLTAIRWIWVSALVATTTACSSNSATPSGDAGAASDGAADAAPGPSPDAAAGTSTLSGLVVDASQLSAAANFIAAKYPPLAGVQVCVYGDSTVPCATTDANGHYSLAGVTVSSTLTLSYAKSGFVPTLWAVGSNPSSTIAGVLLINTATNDGWLQAAGVSSDPTKGELVFGQGTLGPVPGLGELYQENFGSFEYDYVPDYTVSISPAATVGPIYFSSSFMLDPALTAASTAGIGIFQVAPGDYTLTYSAPGLACLPATVTAVAGYANTYVGSYCSPSAQVEDASVDAEGAEDASSDGD